MDNIINGELGGDIREAQISGDSVLCRELIKNYLIKVKEILDGLGDEDKLNIMNECTVKLDADPDNLCYLKLYSYLCFEDFMGKKSDDDSVRFIDVFNRIIKILGPNPVGATQLELITIIYKFLQTIKEHHRDLGVYDLDRLEELMSYYRNSIR